jgi:Ni/Co efflux regulator RcnB
VSLWRRQALHRVFIGGELSQVNRSSPGAFPDEIILFSLPRNFCCISLASFQVAHQQLPRSSIMTHCIRHLALAAVCIFSSLSYAAEDPSVTLDRPGAGVKQIKAGDNVPDEYQRESLALKDWQQRHLSAPGKNEQWVEIQDKYALVTIPTGTIKQMVDKSKVKP